MSEKIYCGNARLVQTQFGELTKVSFSKDDINKMIAYMRQEGSDWINLILKEKKDPKPGKPTHYLEVDTWKPNQAQAHVPQAKDDGSDKLPF
jgi:hypothetical protein